WSIAVGALIAMPLGCIVRDLRSAWPSYWNSAITSNLPAGSTREQIEAWLDEQGLHHEYFDYPNKDMSLSSAERWSMDSIGNQTVAQRAGVDAVRIGP